MKNIIIGILLLLSISTFAQQTPQANQSCNLTEGFKEPVRDKKIKKFERMGPAGNFPTLEDIKNHVAIDNDVDASKIILLKLTEQAGNGIYEYCVNGKLMKYKRMGTVINRNLVNPLDEEK